MAEARRIAVLLVEDSPGDVLLTREALRDAAFDVDLQVVGDGEQALAVLRGGARPDVVLLDVHLPRKDGRDVLREIKADPELADLPVVLMTASAADADILSNLRELVVTFAGKPVDLEAVMRAVDGAP